MTIQMGMRAFHTFDRSVFRRNWKRNNKDPLTKAGLLVRQIMRRSIRRDTSKKQNPSKPGRPPKSRKAGHPFKRIFSVVDTLQTTALVGPVGFGRIKGTPTTVPELHEEGKAIVTKVFTPREQRRRGKRRDSRGRFVKNTQRENAARLFKEGRIKSKKDESDMITKTVRFPRRPFAKPALDKAKTRLPEMWRNSIKE